VLEKRAGKKDKKGESLEVTTVRKRQAPPGGEREKAKKVKERIDDDGSRLQQQQLDDVLSKIF
jgi:hypothetical protein